MRAGVIAQKVGMTRVFTDAGEHVPVTVVRLANCQVVAHRTKDQNGYVALQLGSGTRKVKNTTKAAFEQWVVRSLANDTAPALKSAIAAVLPQIAPQ